MQIYHLPPKHNNNFKTLCRKQKWFKLRGHLQLQCQSYRPKAFVFLCNLFCRPQQHAPQPTHKSTQTEQFRSLPHPQFDCWIRKQLWTKQTTETKQNTSSWSPNKVLLKALVHHTNYKHLHKNKNKKFTIRIRWIIVPLPT